MPLLFPSGGGKKESLEAFQVAPGSRVPVEKAAGRVAGAPIAGIITPGGEVPVERVAAGVASPMSAGAVPADGALTGPGQAQDMFTALSPGPAQQLT